MLKNLLELTLIESYTVKVILVLNVVNVATGNFKVIKKLGTGFKITRTGTKMNKIIGLVTCLSLESVMVQHVSINFLLLIIFIILILITGVNSAVLFVIFLVFFSIHLLVAYVIVFVKISFLEE